MPTYARYTHEELEEIGYSPEEIEEAIGPRPSAARADEDEADWGDGWMRTSSSNIAAIRYNSKTHELQVQFHPPEAKAQAKKVNYNPRHYPRQQGGKRDIDRKFLYPRIQAPGNFSESWGPIYGFSNVPESLWTSFSHAYESFGEFFWANIRGQFGDYRIS